MSDEVKPASYSQVDTAELCLRKWGWRALDRVDGPPNKYAAFGIRVHKLLEDWFKVRRAPDGADTESAVARSLIPYLPPPQAVLPEDVERPFQLLLDDGVPFRGNVDLVHVDPVGRVVTVYDHKTTSDLRWAKSPEDLKKCIQATLYAAAAMDLSGVDRVRLRWNYATRRDRPQVRPVELVVGVEEIAPRLEASARTARQLQLIRSSGLSAHDLPYDASACEAFGGCPYREHCNLTKDERLQSIMSQGEMKTSFLARVEARNKNGGGLGINPPLGQQAAPQPQPAPQPAPTSAPAAQAAPAPTAGAVTSIMQRVAARKAEQAAPAPQPAIIETTIAPQAATPQLGTRVPSGGPTVQSTVAEPALEARGAPDVSATQSAAEEPAKPKRGRPKAPDVVVRAAPATLQAADGYVLYVDCSPVKLPPGSAPPTLATDVVAAAMNDWRESTQTSHYKLGYVVNPDGTKKDLYSAGPALFSEGLSRELRSRTPAAVVAYTSVPEVRDCLQALLDGAHTVVQG